MTLPSDGTPQVPMQVPLQVQLLRAPQLLAAGSAHALNERDAALLALLALDGPSPRARVAALLWPDAESERARSSLRQRLFRLRQRAGRDLVVGDGVLALAPGVAVDVADASPLLHDPAALPGELLAGLHYPADELGRWVDAAREAWRTRRRELLAEAASRPEAEGHVAAALPFAERLAAEEPLFEHAQRRLMRLHHLRGDRAAALAVFETLRSALRRELGVTPGAETLHLLKHVEAGTRLPQAAAPRPAPLLRTPQLIGRSREWAALSAAWDAGRPLLLVGEPGIGKSRLLADFTAPLGALQLQGRSGDAAVPYALLARLVRAVLAACGRPAASLALPDAAREQLALVAVDVGPAPAGARIDALRLQQATHALLAAAGVASLVIDDLHHADGASLDLLSSLWLHSPPPLRLLIAVRGAELPPQLQQRDDDEEATLRRVELGLLDAVQVGELLDALALPGLGATTWAAPLHRHTHGNPLFILETLRALLEQPEPASPVAAEAALPLPPRVGQVIEQRLARLSEPALQLARVAALAGQDFSLDLAAELMARPLLALSEPWRELEAAHVLHDGGFAHDLVLEAARRSVPAPIAQALHGRIAAFLAGRGVPPARLAAHWACAQQWRQAGLAWAEAAQAFFTASRAVDALRCREAAIGAFERTDDAEAAFSQGLYLVAELMQASTGERALAAAERLLARADTDLHRAQARVMCAHANNWLMRIGAYLDHAEQAHALASRLGDAILRCHAAIRYAAALAMNGRAAQALPVLAAVEAWAMRDAPIPMRSNFLVDRANVHAAGDALDDAEAGYAQALALALSDGQVSLARQTLHVARVLDWRRGRLAEVERKLLSALGLREGTTGNEGMARREDTHLGAVRRVQGRFGEAIGLLERALVHCRERGPAGQAALVENELALLWLALGQPARAQQVLQTPAAGLPLHVGAARGVVAVRVALASSGRCCADSLQMLHALAADPACPTAARLLCQVEAALHNEPEPGIAALREALADARQRGGEAVLAAAQIALLRQTLASGRAAAAAQAAADAAAAGAPALALSIDLPEAWWVLGRAFSAGGDTAAASAAWAAARAWIDAALPHVPPPFIDSFLHRNPVNRDVLAARG